MDDRDSLEPGHYRGRFAPSPTGPLHLGSLYTALASYLDARSRGGEWWLRIDDLDPSRSRLEFTERILFSLEALGLEWDGTVRFQSRQSELYRDALARLRADGLLYPCLCSRSQLSALTDRSVYPGYCRRGVTVTTSTPHSLRIRVPESGLIAFVDRVRGPISHHLSQQTGDFILHRRDGVPAYHLATVLDDEAQGITTVLRGADLLDSTPRQIYLQQKLNLTTPEYAHIPILVDERGIKLSKRTLAEEAETRRPGRLLHALLERLNQSPPSSLKKAPVRELLAWGVEHWCLDRLRGVTSIPAASPLGGA